MIKKEITITKNDVHRLIGIAQFFKTAFDTYCEDAIAHEIVNRILKTKLSADAIDFYKEIINIDLHKTKINIKDD